MFNFDKIREYAMKFLKPSLYMGGLDFVLKIWRESDAKNRGILILVFSPMFLCMGGFIFTIIYFVLFVLPSYLFSFLGWGALTALFGAGGKYAYKYFTGHELSAESDGVIDVEFSESPKPEAPSQSSHKRKSQ
ncbi:MAG: hypothetical protein IJQ58_11780 [Synergistaceae bacterium]|nr:hypothetical protein [Synergistaceae bacterium]